MLIPKFNTVTTLNEFHKFFFSITPLHKFFTTRNQQHNNPHLSTLNHDPWSAYEYSRDPALASGLWVNWTCSRSDSPLRRAFVKGTEFAQVPVTFLPSQPGEIYSAVLSSCLCLGISNQSRFLKNTHSHFRLNKIVLPPVSNIFTPLTGRGWTSTNIPPEKMNRAQNANLAPRVPSPDPLFEQFFGNDNSSPLLNSGGTWPRRLWRPERNETPSLASGRPF